MELKMISKMKAEAEVDETEGDYATAEKRPRYDYESCSEWADVNDDGIHEIDLYLLDSPGEVIDLLKC